MTRCRDYAVGLLFLTFLGLCNGAVLGEDCDGISQNCTATNTLCLNGKCVCDGNSYRDSSSDTCVSKSKPGRNCSSSDDCLSPHSVCSRNVCLCRYGYKETNGECKVDIGFYCKQATACADTSAICSGLSPTCTCNPSTHHDTNEHVRGGECVQKVPLGFNCSNTACLTPHATCWNVCKCRYGYKEVNGECKVDIGFYCKQATDCADTSAICTGLSTSCTCNPATHYDTNGPFRGGECVQKVPLGFNCSHTACLTPHAVCSRNICECGLRYKEANGECKIDIGFSCKQATDCADSAAICSGLSPVCTCNSSTHHDKTSGVCVPKVSLGSNCSNTGCLTPRSVCSRDVCQCAFTYKEANGECKIDLGAQCSDNTDCADTSAICTGAFSQSCTCDPSTHVDTNGYHIGGVCVEKTIVLYVGEPGGPCTSESLCVAPYTVCFRGRCECQVGYKRVNSRCKVDLGYPCSHTSDCADTGAICTGSSPVCTCNEDTHYDLNGASNGGYCEAMHWLHNQLIKSADPDETAPAGAVSSGSSLFTEVPLGSVALSSEACLAQHSVRSSSAICVCGSGFQRVGEECKVDLGFTCNSASDCADVGAVCVVTSSAHVCACNTSTLYDTNKITISGGDCEARVPLRSACPGTEACLTPHAVCSTRSICECDYGYQRVNDECKVDLGYSCNTVSDCADMNTSCEGATSGPVCTCNSTSHFGTNGNAGGGDCVAKVPLRAYCPGTDACLVPNSACSRTVCVCDGGYQRVNDECKVDLGFPCNTASECADVSASCLATTSGPISVCTCDASTHYDTNGLSTEGDCVAKQLIGSVCPITEACLTQHTVCSGSVCACEHGYQKQNEECKVDLGYDCTASTDCADIGAYCTHPGSKCACNTTTHYDTNTVASGGDCIAKGSLGSFCPNSDGCVPANSVCQSNVCICGQGYQEQHNECGVDLGFTCTMDSECADTAAVCTGSPRLCTCNPITHHDTNNAATGGDCKAKSPLGSSCTDSNACLTSHSSCISNICDCEQGYQAVGPECKTDLGFDCALSAECADKGAYCMLPESKCACNGSTHYDTNDLDTGGDCMLKVNLGHACTTDYACLASHASCQSNICVCEHGYQESNNDCKAESKPERNCSSSDDCLSPHSVCSRNVCLCRYGYKQTNGECKVDIGFYCTQATDCADTSALCSGLSPICTCNPTTHYDTNGYLRGGDCVQRVPLGANCSNTECLTAHSVCSQSVCECGFGKKEANGECKTDIGFYCKQATDCADTSAICSGLSPKCTCNPSTHHDTNEHVRGGECVQKVPLGSNCSNTTCLTSHSACWRNVCKCGYGYKEVNGECKVDIGFYCKQATDCADTSAICTGLSTSCTCNPATHYDTNGPFRGGECVQKVPLGSNCSHTACLTSHAVCSRNICECGYGYKEANGECKIDIGFYCKQATDCADTSAICTGLSTSCTCNPVTHHDTNGVARGGACVPKVSLGFNCTNTGCLTPRSVCSRDVCECAYSYKEANGECKIDLGFTCSDNADCADPSAICIGLSRSCTCDPSTHVDTNEHFQGGECVKKTIVVDEGVPGGPCTSESLCVAPNTECSWDRCVCKDGYERVNTGCKVDLGYPCSQTSDCSDAGAVCIGSSPVCTCRPDTHYDINGASKGGYCEAKVPLDTICRSTEACLAQHAVCPVGHLCVCDSDFQQVGEECKVDLGFTCNSASDCADVGALCIATSSGNFCNCNTSTHYDTNTLSRGGDCEARVPLRSACPMTEACLTPHAVCSARAICECDSGYQRVNGECKVDLGYSCNTASDCADMNTSCEGTTSGLVCTCISTTHFGTNGNAGGGDCAAKVPLRAYCPETEACLAPNSICSGTVCVCDRGYQRVNEECKVGLGFSCNTASDCADVSASCIGTTSGPVCTCNASTHYDTNGLSTGGDCVAKQPLRSACPYTEACMTPNAVCSGNVCVCDSDYQRVDNECKLDLGFSCSTDSECADVSGICTVGGTTSPVCSCDASTHYDTNKQAYSRGDCVEKPLLGSVCPFTEACLTQHTVCSGSLCVCEQGYQKQNEECRVDLGYDCTISTDCADIGAYCTNPGSKCACNTTTHYDTNTVAGGGDCIAKGSLGSFCPNSDGCLPANSACRGNICICGQGYQEHNNKCSVDLGFSCTEDSECADTAAVCTGSPRLCTCSTSTHYDTNNAATGGDCKAKEPLGYFCPNNDGCLPANSVCRGNVCICGQGYQEQHNECGVDLGFSCTMDSECADTAAVCTGSPRLCTCNTSTHYDTNNAATGGDCKAKSPLGSPCPDNNACLTSHSSCISNICDCGQGYQAVGDECKIDLGFDCALSANCADISAYCMLPESKCACNGSTHYDTNGIATGGDCMAKVNLGYACTADYVCLASHSSCQSRLCVCEHGYQESNNNCKVDLGFSCSIDSECADTAAVCTGSPRVCSCNTSTHYATNGGAKGGECKLKAKPERNCSSSDDCLSPHSICFRDVCICKYGYKEALNGECKVDIGFTCINATDCADTTTICAGPSPVCTCNPTTHVDTNGPFQGGECVEKVQLGSNCSTTDCITPHSVCTWGVCECGYSYKEISGECKVDIGFYCKQATDCADSSAICSGLSPECTCNPATHYDTNGRTQGGDCVQKVPLGSNCSNTECLNSYAVCSRGVCECGYGFKEANGKCKVDIGFHCYEPADCADTTAICTGLSPVCTCDPATYFDTNAHFQGGECVQKVTLGSNCSNTDCLTSHSVCSRDVCKCSYGYKEANGKCKIDLGFPCSDNLDCADASAICIGVSQVCTCDPNTHVDTNEHFQGGDCVKKTIVVDEGLPGGPCTSESFCIAPNTVCSWDRCVCKDGYERVNTGCKVDLGYPCSQDSDCSDIGAVCTGTAPVCTCSPNTHYDVNGASYGGYCEEKVPLGSVCAVTEACLTSNAVCSGHLCLCESKYQRVNEECKVDLGFSCIAASECADVSASCIDTTSGPVCTCNAGTHYDTNGMASGGDCLSKVPLRSACPVTDACLTAHAVCSGNVCECDNHYQTVNDQCKIDLGYSCSNANDCADVSAYCLDSTSGHVCTCNASTHFDTNGMGTGGDCIAKEPLRSGCPVTEACLTPHAVCSGNVCVCGSGYQRVNEECKIDLGFSCSSHTDCADATGSCTGSSKSDPICSCNSSTHYDTNGKSTGGDCIAKEPVGSVCPFSEGCLTSHTTCSGNVCVCDQGYQKRNEECKVDLGFDCVFSSDCADMGAYCTISESKCACNASTHFDTNGAATGGDCEAKGALGAVCSDTSGCITANSVCQGNMCVCDQGFKEHNRECIVEGILGANCTDSSDCNGANTECKNGVCRCKSSYYVTGTICQKMVDLGSPCNKTEACKTQGSNCTKNICECNSDLYDDNGATSPGGECSQKKALHKECSGNPADVPHQCIDTQAVCQESSGVYYCSCVTNYHPDESNTSCIPVPSEPKDIEIVEINIHYVTINWDRPENINAGNVLGYIIQIKLSIHICVQEIVYMCSDCTNSFQVGDYDESCASHLRSVHWRKQGDLIIQQSYQIRDLQPASQYTIYISVVSLTGRGQVAQHVVTTLQEAPKKPQNVTVVDVSPTSIMISWTIIGEDLGSTVYIISIVPAPPLPPRNISVSAARRSVTVTDLEENWPYNIAVAAENERGTAHAEELVSHLTVPTAPGPVSDFSATTAPNGNYEQILATWAPPSVLDRNSRIIHYVFNPDALADTSQKIIVPSIDDHQRYTEAVSVEPGNSYTFEVYAVNEENQVGEISRLEVSAPEEETNYKQPLVIVGAVLGAGTVALAVGLTVTLVKYLSLRRLVTDGISSMKAPSDVTLSNIEAASTLETADPKQAPKDIRL